MKPIAPTTTSTQTTTILTVVARPMSFLSALEGVAEERQHAPEIHHTHPAGDRRKRDRLVGKRGVVARLDLPRLVERGQVEQVEAGEHQESHLPEERDVRAVLFWR